MENNSSSIDLGTIAVILTIVFAVLKLAGIVTWSWWIVFLPVLAVLVLSVVMIVLILLGLSTWHVYRNHKFNKKFKK
ncbi:hypothetical protein [Limosilactobacillus agrestimuris]|uniref:hypothetical protein n=1 Tax=Limosilactobacillus agrestimuris TaxID=2941331 RepID=UPI002041CD11|nr:hypothetical protein [Limosilactobacillus agrestimuris]